MNKHFEILRKTRSNFLQLTNDLNIGQLNKIPTGFNNNIIWHLGHLVCTQQILCYKLANTEPRISLDLVSKFGRGTKPDTYVPQQEADQLKEFISSHINELEQDYLGGRFVTYTQVETAYGITLSTIEDAIRFASVHEGLHFGYVMAMKKLV